MLEANEGLENIFENALKEAEKRKHEYVTIEHVLLSLIKDEAIGTVLHDFKIQVGALIKDVEDYLDTKCNDIVAKGKEPMTPRKTASLERLMNRAFTQALFQGRQDVSSVDILISIFSEKKSYAAFFLKKHQVNKQDLTDLVSTETILDEGMAALSGAFRNGALPHLQVRPSQSIHPFRVRSRHVHTPRSHAWQVLTIEPMINAGGAALAFAADSWTARTADGSLSAQWEHTVALTHTGHEILTLRAGEREPAFRT